MICKNCGKEIDNKAVVCIHCGNAVKPKKSKNILKKWWFWLIVAIVVIAVASSGGNTENTNDTTVTTSNGEHVSDEATLPVEVVYEVVDLRTMFDDLKNNAMKAEANYQKKHIEVTGEISSFDSDGKYISIRVVGGDAWDFDTMLCKIKNDEQRALLIERSVGDEVTLKGKVTSIGEVLGYSMDIEAIV